jgi:hypothetical protein
VERKTPAVQSANLPATLLAASWSRGVGQVRADMANRLPQGAVGVKNPWEQARPGQAAASEDSTTPKVFPGQVVTLEPPVLCRLPNGRTQ